MVVPQLLLSHEFGRNHLRLMTGMRRGFRVNYGNPLLSIPNPFGLLHHLSSSVHVKVDQELPVGEVSLVHPTPVAGGRLLESKHLVPALEVVVLLSIPILDYHKPEIIL